MQNNNKANEVATISNDSETADIDLVDRVRQRCRSSSDVEEQQSYHRERRHHHHFDYIPAEDAGIIFDGDGASQIYDMAGDSESDDGTEKSFRIIRPVYTQQEFDECHGGKSVRVPLSTRIKHKFHFRRCSKERAIHYMWRTLPFLKIMKNYNVKEWLLSDIICGLTVGIMHIPQGMAYAFLAALPPYIGLYTSFFPPLVYFFFGTSRQISMGTIAIVSLLTGSLLETRFPADVNGNNTVNFNNSMDELLSTTTLQTTTSDDLKIEPDYIKSRIALASLLCFCVGMLQLAMGCLRLGFLTRYLSDPLVSGFTMGASFHVFTSQIKYALGLEIKRRIGLFKIPLHYYDIAINLPNANPVTVGIAAISIVILFVSKQFLNPRIQKKIKAPLPMELIIVILGTVLSYVLSLKERYDVKIVGHIPTGIPQPEFPSFSLFQSSMLMDIITISIISFSVCVSLAKIFAKKHNYEVDPSQELIAYGVCNFVSCFFRCWPAASSLSRSAVQDSMKGKTQLVAIFSSLLLLSVLLFIGKYFETVPNCCLSAIILVALKGMFVQIKELPTLWRLSVYDFWTWIVTCLCVIVLDVEYGLLIGLAFSICTVIVRTQAPTSSTLGRIPCTDLYKNVEAYSNTEEVAGIKIYRFEGSVYFACADNFRLFLYKRTGVNPRKIVSKRHKIENRYNELVKKNSNAAVCCAISLPNKKSYNLDKGGPASDEQNNEQVEVESKSNNKFSNMTLNEKIRALTNFGLSWPTTSVHHIILDASTWGYIDYVGVRALNQVIQEYKSIDINVYIANPKCGIRECLERSDFYQRNRRDILYVSVHDAVIAAQYERKMRIKRRASDAATAALQEDDETNTKDE